MSHDREPDLAAIILESEARRSTDWRVRLQARYRDVRASGRRDYDATSVAVLVLAMLGIAMVLGFVVDALRDDDVQLPAATSTAGPLQAPGAELVAGDARPAQATKPTTAKPAAIAPGVDLVASRITAAKTPGRYGVTLGVRVANTGADPLTAASGSLMTVIVDGGIAAVRPMVLAGATSAGPAAASEIFQLDSCAAGTHAVTVIVDSNARVSEAREDDNARSTQLDWTC